MKITALLSVLIIVGCASKYNSRAFQFTYEVDIESTDSNKLELWIPVPNSNEVQTISNLKFNTNGLKYSIENEEFHGNKYLYINDTSGTTITTNISIKFNVMRKEHQNIIYKDVDPNKYLGSYNAVPTGGIFEKIAKWIFTEVKQN